MKPFDDLKEHYGLDPVVTMKVGRNPEALHMTDNKEIREAFAKAVRSAMVLEDKEKTVLVEHDAYKELLDVITKCAVEDAINRGVART